MWKTPLTWPSHGLKLPSGGHIAFPVDIQAMEAERKGSQRNVPHHTSDVFARSARLPEEADLQRS